MAATMIPANAIIVVMSNVVRESMRRFGRGTSRIVV